MSTVKVNIVGDSSGLTRASKSAQSSIAGITKSTLPAMGSFGKLGSSLMGAFSPQNLANGPMAAVAAIAAVGATAKEVFDLLIDSSKAWFDETRGIVAMDMALGNNTDATYEQIQAIEGQIDSLSMLTAIQDGELRKSYTQLVQDTHDATKSMELLTLATDIHAGTDLDLTKITKNLGKAYNGNTAALRKMFPDLKAGGDWADQLKTKFNGMGEAIGNLSPFERMAIAADNLKEAFGTILAPLIMKFTQWLASEDFQKWLADVATFSGNLGIALYNAIRPMFTLIEWLNSPVGKLALYAVTGPFVAMTMDALGSKNSAFADEMERFKKGILDAGKQLKGFKFNFDDAQVDPAPLEQRIKDAAEKIKASATKFRDSVQFSMGLSEDSKFFNADLFMNKMRDVLTAAKKLPAKLAELRKAGASKEMLQEIVAQGPQAGLAIAEGFLRTGTTSEYVKSTEQLSKLGGRTMANAAGQATYNINVTKANMTAEEIISVIQKYEKKTGRKVSF